MAEMPPSHGRIISVYDGDTYTLSDGSKIRLRGVNTPELRPKEEFGIEARILSVQGPQLVGRQHLELPIQVREEREVRLNDA